MNIEIDIAGKTLEFSVTPFHAAIIYKFQEKGLPTATSRGCVTFIAFRYLDDRRSERRAQMLDGLHS